MAKPYPQAVLFGDSLFEFACEIKAGFSFQAKLQDRCRRRLDVINRGMGGWNTANALKYLPEIFPEPSESSPRIEIFIVLLGANDAVLPLPTTIQHVPIDQYKENLKKIVTHPNITAHNPKVILVTPPPLDEIRSRELDTAEHGGPQRMYKISADYSQKAREVAEEVPGVILVDLWQAITDAAIKDTTDYTPGDGNLGEQTQGALPSYLPDGLHMSGKAYEVFYNVLSPHIKGDWATRGTVFPEWRDINPPR